YDESIPGGGSAMSNPHPLSPAEATAKINQIAAQGGFIRLSKHCRDRMAERTATLADVRQALRNGVVAEPAEWDSQYGQWHYRVAGYDLVGDTLTVITVIFDANFAVLAVTIME